ncbi:MAG: hypothetical protein J6R35_00985, partial [Clostridia bacterium]|nr:hypothetical protein [Clostridia bacterium]
MNVYLTIVDVENDSTGPSLTLTKAGTSLGGNEFETSTNSFTVSAKETATALSQYELLRNGSTQTSPTLAVSTNTKKSHSQEKTFDVTLTSGAYGTYTIKVYDIEGKCSTATVHYFKPTIVLKIKLGSNEITDTSIAQVGFAGEGYGYSKTATEYFPSSFNARVKVAPGYYFKGFSHGGTFNGNFKNDMMLTEGGTNGLYTMVTAPTSTGTGEINFAFTVNSAVLKNKNDETGYIPTNGTITLYAEIGQINVSNVPSTAVDYLGGGKTEVTPSINLDEHKNVLGTTNSMGSTVAITGYYGYEGNYVAIGETLGTATYAGKYDAVLTLTWGGIVIGTKKVSFTINPRELAVAPVFGSKTVVTK